MSHLCIIPTYTIKTSLETYIGCRAEYVRESLRDNTGRESEIKMQFPEVIDRHALFSATSSAETCLYMEYSEDAVLLTENLLLVEASVPQHARAARLRERTTR